MTRGERIKRLYKKLNIVTSKLKKEPESSFELFKLLGQFERTEKEIQIQKAYQAHERG